MGWTGFYKNPTEIREKFLNSFNSDPNYEVIDYKSTCAGRKLWVAVQGKESSFIFLVLSEKQKEGWLYKDIDESMGPSYYDCPLSLIEKTTGDGSKWSKGWREEVKKFQIKKSTVYGSGDLVKVYDKEYCVVRKHKRSYLIRSLENGKVYKCGAAKIDLVKKYE